MADSDGGVLTLSQSVTAKFGNEDEEESTGELEGEDEADGGNANSDFCWNWLVDKGCWNARARAVPSCCGNSAHSEPVMRIKPSERMTSITLTNMSRQVTPCSVSRSRPQEYTNSPGSPLVACFLYS